MRYADVRGYSYDREDVTARGLASVYAQSLGAVFTAESKPFEVELAVAEVGETIGQDHIYRLTFDGSIADESGFIVMGGQADAVVEALRGRWSVEQDFGETIRAAVESLRHDGGTSAEPRAHLGSKTLEVAVLDRDPLSARGSARAFRRVPAHELDAMLSNDRAVL